MPTPQALLRSGRGSTGTYGPCRYRRYHPGGPARVSGADTSGESTEQRRRDLDRSGELLLSILSSSAFRSSCSSPTQALPGDPAVQILGHGVARAADGATGPARPRPAVAEPVRHWLGNLLQGRWAIAHIAPVGRVAAPRPWSRIAGARPRLGADLDSSVNRPRIGRGVHRDRPFDHAAKASCSC